MTHKYEMPGWTVTLPAPGARFIGHIGTNPLGRAFFRTRREALDYRDDWLGEVQAGQLARGEYRVIRATLTLTASEASR